MTESNPSERRQRGSGTILPGGRRGEDPDTQLRPPASPTARVARYRLIVEELDDVVSRHNRAGRFLDVSESATAIFGRSPAQLLSCTWRDVIHPDDTLPFEEWWRSVHGGSPGSLGFRILRPDRSVVWVETSAAAGVLLEEGVFEVQAVTRDISTRVEQLESAVRRARELEEEAARLDRSNQELARFAADAAHDLRAPLQVISGFAQLLARREGSRLDVTSQRFVASVLAAVGDMVELLDAALDQGRPTLAHRHPTPVDAGEVAARVVERLKSEIRSTKATVAVGPLPVVHTDRAQLGRLFQNLLSNALKSAPPHQHPRVTIAAERVEGGWEMSVSDQGVGVAPDDRERIFEVFERGARAYQAGGTGIGLSICKSIVERQGGRIWVEDAPTGGARFIFFLADEPV